MPNLFSGSIKFVDIYTTYDGIDLEVFGSYINHTVRGFTEPLREIQWELFKPGGIFASNFKNQYGPHKWKMLSGQIAPKPTGTYRWRTKFRRKWRRGSVGAPPLQFTGGLFKAATMNNGEEVKRHLALKRLENNQQLSQGKFGQGEEVRQLNKEMHSYSSMGRLVTKVNASGSVNTASMNITMEGDGEANMALAAHREGGKIPQRDFWFISASEKSKLVSILNGYYRDKIKGISRIKKVHSGGTPPATQVRGFIPLGGGGGAYR